MIFLLSLIFYPLTTQQLDLLAIVSKSKPEVESILGKSEKVELFQPVGQECKCEWYHYLDDQVRIIYMADKVDRIFASFDVEIINLDIVKIHSFHRWKDHVEIRVSGQNEFCSPL